MCLMDAVTAYLYRSLDNDIYMKIPEGYKMPEAYNSKFQIPKYLFYQATKIFIWVKTTWTHVVQ
jgi:hypothetical protein